MQNFPNLFAAIFLKQNLNLINFLLISLNFLSFILKYTAYDKKSHLEALMLEFFKFYIYVIKAVLTVSNKWLMFVKMIYNIYRSSVNN